MTIISQSRNVCIRTERTAASTVEALLRIDMMTDTTGDWAVMLIYRCLAYGWKCLRHISLRGQQSHSRQTEAGFDNTETLREFSNDLVDRASRPDIIIRFR